jgi:hypothetical protein
MKQTSLFPEQLEGPTGLRYAPDFISVAEEAELIHRIHELPLTPFQFGAFEGKRRVVSFGWRYDYGDHSLQKAGELPDWLKPYVSRAEAFDELELGSIGQVSCSEYEKASVLDGTAISYILNESWDCPSPRLASFGFGARTVRNGTASPSMLSHVRYTA